MELRTATVGCLLGTAAGDAVGLVAEGLTRARQRRLVRNLNGPALFLRHGMVSDDTDHAVMVARALIGAGEDADAFARSLGRQLRAWLLALPAGVGFATLRAGLKLLAGAGPESSGVFSAGNGPAMRAPLVGIAFNHDREAMVRFVRAATRLTHTDPKAEWGAVAVALAAAMASASQREIRPLEFLDELSPLMPPEASELSALIETAAISAGAGDAAEAFCDRMGLSRGVSGYTFHTVPVVLQTWLRHQGNFAGGVLDLIRCGGDTDTTAAILGGIVGGRVGRAGVPADWLDRLWLWPLSVEWLEGLGDRLADVRRTGVSRSAPPVPYGRLVARNALFTTLVLAHGFRRLLPPY